MKRPCISAGLFFLLLPLGFPEAAELPVPSEICNACGKATTAKQFNQACDHYWYVLRSCQQVKPKGTAKSKGSAKLPAICSDQKIFELCSGLRLQCSGELRLFMDLQLKSQEDIDEYFYCYSLNSGNKNEIEGPDYTKYRKEIKPLIETAAKGFKLDSRMFSCLVFRESGNWRESNLPQLTDDAQAQVNLIMGDPEGQPLPVREMHKEWKAYVKAHPRANPGPKLDRSEFENKEIAIHSAGLYLKFIHQTVKRSLCQKSIRILRPKNLAAAYDACMLQRLDPHYEILSFAAYNWGTGTLESVLSNTRHDLKSILKYLEANPVKETEERRKEMRNHLISLLNCSLRDRWQPQPGSKKTDFRCHDEWSIDEKASSDAGLDF